MNSLLMKVPILHRLLGGPTDDSRNAARNRLKKALVGDRQTVAPQLMSCLQSDIEACMSKYLRADKDAGVYKLKDNKGKMTLSIEVPILCILRQSDLPEEALKKERADESIELKLDGKKLRKKRSRRHRSKERN